MRSDSFLCDSRRLDTSNIFFFFQICFNDFVCFRTFLPAKPLVAFTLLRAHFGDFRRCGPTHFVIGFAGVW